jgi:hypothetical protein
MAAKTQFHAGDGYGGRRYGSFAGKEESAGDSSGTRRQRQIKSLTRSRRRRRRWEPHYYPWFMDGLRHQIW